jgi:hypothetical protein
VGGAGSPRLIQAWSEAYGVPDDGRCRGRLDFVTTVVAPYMECANEIVTKGMTLSEARMFVETWIERSTR